MSVVATHPDVVSHQPYTSIRDVQIKEEEREEREEEEQSKVREMEVKELWKPHAPNGSARFFTEGGFEYALRNPSRRGRADDVMYYSSSALYSYSDLQSTVNKYVDTRQLTDPRDRTYVNVGTDEVLLSMVCRKGVAPESVKPLKREEIVQRLSQKMQRWYGVQTEGKDPVVKYVTFFGRAR